MTDTQGVKTAERPSAGANRRDRDPKPSWLKTRIPTGATFYAIKRDLRDRQLYTVCEEAKCPNIGQCWNDNTATFMVLGGTCTRACRFCNVATGDPQGWVDRDEPRQVAESASQMGLDYIVLTMVDRDDIPDGGAAHVRRVVEAVRAASPKILVEILAGDFQGSTSALDTMLAPKPEVFAHNLETVERLTPRVRDARASYRQSLRVLENVQARAPYPVVTKSSLMLGLGETTDEIHATLKDLRAVGVTFLTLGQYMRPTKKHLSVKRWVPPEEFDELAATARSLGFRSVASGPLVRSSYRARAYYHAAQQT